MVYAIARQESAFNPAAVSGAGARGLLQLMPATAKAMAKSVGVTYSQDRLTSDPAYNAQLGAAFLGKLQASYGGSFIMTFAAYNAGPSRVTAWIKEYGDPRDPNVDAVNWIERIPFTRDAQLRPAHHGEPAGLSGPARLTGADHRTPTSSAADDRVGLRRHRLRRLFRNAAEATIRDTSPGETTKRRPYRR